MVSWILAVLALFVLQTLLPPAFRLFAYEPGRDRLSYAFGPRDNPLPLPVVGQRAERARRNMGEALPVFLALALLSLVLGKAEGAATTGAMIFFLARLAYVPSYLVGTAGLRTACWTVGWVGLGIMIAAVLG